MKLRFAGVTLGLLGLALTACGAGTGVGSATADPSARTGREPGGALESELRGTVKVPQAQREFRAAWVATVANIDWPSRAGLSTEQQKSEMIAILNRAKELNLNALIFQIRPCADAFYDSKLEPWSEYLTGKQGQPPSPYYDPLAFTVEEAHKRGLELHVWFNPYRARHMGSKANIADNHISKLKPSIVKRYGKYLWMDPGEQETMDHTMAVVTDVARRYDIDGVHIDDYFYPYKEKGEDGKLMPFPDDESYKKYQEAGGKLERDDWRRNNVDRFVERFYKEVKAVNPHIKVGISPFGIWKGGHPPTVTGMSQYDELYADAKLWLNKGWVDYWTPQLYWKIDSKQPYKDLLAWWVQENTEKRHVWPGLGTHSVGKWGPVEIVNQVLATRAQKGAGGNVHFSFKVLQNNTNGVADALQKGNGPYAVPALVPPSPWIDAVKPPAPTLEGTRDAKADTVVLNWKAGDTEKPRVWALYNQRGSLKATSAQPGGAPPAKPQWNLRVLPPETTTISLPTASAGEVFAISAVDVNGNESERRVLILPESAGAEPTVETKAATGQ